MIRIVLLLTISFISGCAALTTTMEERNPIGTFTTTLNVKGLVDCVNQNQPPSSPYAIIPQPLILWSEPTKFTDGSSVFYYFNMYNEPIMAFILENGIAEMYNYNGKDNQYIKQWRDHYASFCGG